MSANKKNVSAKVQPKRGSGSPMDVSMLEEMVRLMAANDLNTIDVRDGEKRIILRRGAPQVAMPMAYAPALHAPPSASRPAEAPAEDVNLIAVKSPMVGTFYASPGPDAKTFVSVGSHVSDDTDVCIIEAMKVFNNIKAECKGTVTKVLVSNGQTVEFGQTLFLVKP